MSFWDQTHIIHWLGIKYYNNIKDNTTLESITYCNNVLDSIINNLTEEILHELFYENRYEMCLEVVAFVLIFFYEDEE